MTTYEFLEKLAWLLFRGTIERIMAKRQMALRHAEYRLAQKAQRDAQAASAATIGKIVAALVANFPVTKTVEGGAG